MDRHTDSPTPARSTYRVPRRRIPAFHPVPVGSRRDGWTPQRQADFIGWLAQTRSVQEACTLTGMGREGAYRLRRRIGAAGFAAAWDAALGKPHRRIDLTSGKATQLPASWRSEHGLIVIVMYQGRYCANRRKPDDDALLQHLAAIDRGGHEWAFAALGAGAK